MILHFKLNVFDIFDKNADFTGFLRDLINERSILVVNKSDLGVDNMINNFKKNRPTNFCYSSECS